MPALFRHVAFWVTWEPQITERQTETDREDPRAHVRADHGRVRSLWLGLSPRLPPLSTAPGTIASPASPAGSSCAAERPPAAVGVCVRKRSRRTAQALRCAPAPVRRAPASEAASYRPLARGVFGNIFSFSATCKSGWACGSPGLWSMELADSGLSA